ncbi:MAG TPA: HDOD domain-containing protein [Burkholderiales bacterium]|nr:HDOD domain-containing protein [Burkholderiales bacterium]
MSRAGDLALAGAIGDLHRLPSPRGVALELLRLARDENASVGDVARVVHADPALASRLIHVANGTAPRIGSIGAAVLRLGFTATRHIALGFSLVNDYRQGACERFDYKAFWTGSLLRGLAARAIAARLGVGDPQEAFACGLLAEIGRLALATAQPAAYGDLLAVHGQSGSRLRAGERERFAIDHGALGGSLLARWGVPGGLVSAVDGYFAPPINADGPDRQVRRTAWTLILAETVVRAAAAPVGERGAWRHLALEGAARLETDAALLEAVTGEVAREARSWMPLLELPMPSLGAPDFPGYADIASAGQAEADGLRILVVDDDESDRLLLRLALEKAGHQVRLAKDGREALAAIAAAAPQLVITDIDMPRMNGLDLCRTLRDSRYGAGLYVIALTGRERHEDLAECIDAGANDFVAKSAAPEVLGARVRAAARMVRSGEALHAELDAVRNFATALAIDRRRSEINARRA